jgi:hypothetical protein
MAIIPVADAGAPGVGIAVCFSAGICVRVGQLVRAQRVADCSSVTLWGDPVSSGLVDVTGAGSWGAGRHRITCGDNRCSCPCCCGACYACCACCVAPATPRSPLRCLSRARHRRGASSRCCRADAEVNDLCCLPLLLSRWADQVNHLEPRLLQRCAALGIHHCKAPEWRACQSKLTDASVVAAAPPSATHSARRPHDVVRQLHAFQLLLHHLPCGVHCGMQGRICDRRRLPSRNSPRGPPHLPPWPPDRSACRSEPCRTPQRRCLCS